MVTKADIPATTQQVVRHGVGVGVGVVLHERRLLIEHFFNAGGDIPFLLDAVAQLQAVVHHAGHMRADRVGHGDDVVRAADVLRRIDAGPTVLAHTQ